MIKLSSWKINKNSFTYPKEDCGCYVFQSNKIIFVNKDNVYLYDGITEKELSICDADHKTITHRFVSDGKNILTPIGDSHVIDNKYATLKLYKNELDVYAIYQWIWKEDSRIINITLYNDTLIFGLKYPDGLEIIDFNLKDKIFISISRRHIVVATPPSNIFIYRDADGKRNNVYYHVSCSLNVWTNEGIALLLDSSCPRWYFVLHGANTIYFTNGMNLFSINANNNPSLAHKVSYLASSSPTTINVTIGIQITVNNDIFAFGSNAFWTFQLGEIHQTAKYASSISTLYKYNYCLLNDLEEKDVIILCKDNNTVLANKIFLKNSCCDYFKTILTTDWCENGIRKRMKSSDEMIKIDCTEISVSVMNIIITYIYTTILKKGLTPEEFIELCKVAEKFMMKEFMGRLLGRYQYIVKTEDKSLFVLKSLYDIDAPWTIPFKEVWLSRYISIIPSFDWNWEELYNISKIEALMYDITCLRHSM